MFLLYVVQICHIEAVLGLHKFSLGNTNTCYQLESSYNIYSPGTSFYHQMIRQFKNLNRFLHMRELF